MDFIAINDEGESYYQVSQTVMEEQTLSRELASLDAIKEDHNSKCLIIMDYMPLTSHKGIKQINVLEWLVGIVFYKFREIGKQQ